MMLLTADLLYLLGVVQLAVGAPATTADPDSEVEIVPPLENTEVESEAETDATAGYDEYDQESFGFGELPSIAGSFGGFGGGLEEVKNIDLSSLFGTENGDPSISVSLSVEPGVVLGHNSEVFSLRDLLSSITSGNRQHQSSFGNFGASNKGSQFGSGIFGTRNLEGFLRKPQSSFLDIFGSQAGSLKPLVGLGDIIGIGSTKQSSSSLGVFSGLTGGPWSSFQSIFALYNQPEVRGYREVFGPVYGGGCGLCQLFTSGTVSLEGAIVTIELVDDNHEYPDNIDYNYHYEVLEEETIPGGTAVMINETTIRVLDDNGEGIYFLLDTSSDPSKPQAGDKEGENVDGFSEYEITEDNISADDENIQTDEEVDVRNTPTENGMIDQNTTPGNEGNETFVETTTMDKINDYIDDGLLEESSTEENTDVKFTTELPAVFDAGRFDIVNDKITNGGQDDSENSMAKYPEAIQDGKSNVSVDDAESRTENVIEEDTYIDISNSQTSPTLLIDNIYD